MEDDLPWKMTFGGRQPLVTHNLSKRRPSVEEDLQWKTTFDGRRPDDLWVKTTFGGRRLLVEDNLRWKTTFGGRQPSVEDDLLEEDLRWILACCLVRFAAFFPKGLKCLSLSNISLNCLLTRHPRL